jgi:hypothetical protein
MRTHRITWTAVLMSGSRLLAFFVLALVQSGTLWAGPILDQSYDPSSNETINVTVQPTLGRSCSLAELVG